MLSLICAPPLRAQEIVDQALQVFPYQTERLEYWNVEALRETPSLEALRDRYTGPQLQSIENTFAKVGIGKADIDELVLGWGKSAGGLYGLAAGRFKSDDITRRAAGLGLTPHPLAHIQAFCPTSGGSEVCFAVLDATQAAFAGAKDLSSIVTAVVIGTTAEGPPLSSRRGFADLASGKAPDAPVWGVAQNSAALDWLSFWASALTGMQVSWRGFISGVKMVAWGISSDDDDQIHLALAIQCASPAEAEKLDGLLASLRVLGRVGWHTKNPSLPNPFAAANLNSSGDSVELKLVVPISEIQDVTKL